MNPDKLSAGDWFFGTFLKMGANWKTTLGGILKELLNVLVLLSIAPYSLPENITSIIPAKAKGWFFAICGGAKTIVAIWTWWNTKSKNVTGGDTQQTLSGDLAKPGTQNLVDATAEAKAAQ